MYFNNPAWSRAVLDRDHDRDLS